MAATASPPPRWITAVLSVAAAYNLAWGAFVAFFPTQLFAGTGLEPPNHPSLIQCLGAIIGVFGVGYALAARDPVTHWGIVFLGLLSKIFGPIGFVIALTQGDLPATGWITVFANDVVWWLPFTAILLYAARERDARRHAGETTSLEETLKSARTDAGHTLWELSHERPTLVVLIRHSGCTFCRETLADLNQQLPRIRQSGGQAVVVHMSPPSDGRQLLDRFGLTDVEQISDPERRLYRAFELPLGTLRQLAGPRVIWRALTSGVLWRYGFGRIIGAGMQLAGAILIDHGRVTRAYRHQTTADRPNYADVACGTR